LGPDLTNLATAAAPYVLGLAIGFGTAVYGLRRWLTVSALRPSANLVSTLRRVGFQYLAVGIVLTVAGSNWMARQLGVPVLEVTQHCLWGLPFGLFTGTRWVLRRGER
jgi:hypothetical protein